MYHFVVDFISFAPLIRFRLGPPSFNAHLRRRISFQTPTCICIYYCFFSPGVVLIVRMSIRGTDTWCIGDPPTPPLPPPPLLLLPPPFPVSKRTKVRPSSFLEIYHSDLAASIPPLLIFSGIFEIFMLKWWNPFGTPFSVRHLF